MHASSKHYYLYSVAAFPHLLLIPKVGICLGPPGEGYSIQHHADGYHASPKRWNRTVRRH